MIPETLDWLLDSLNTYNKARTRRDNVDWRRSSDREDTEVREAREMLESAFETAVKEVAEKILDQKIDELTERGLIRPI